VVAEDEHGAEIGHAPVKADRRLRGRDVLALGYIIAL
jgi:hypothetical protein